MLAIMLNGCTVLPQACPALVWPNINALALPDTLGALEWNSLNGQALVCLGGAF